MSIPTHMIDITHCNSVEIQIDTNGKVWVNVDGICRFRVNKSEYVVVDDPINGSVAVVSK